MDSKKVILIVIVTVIIGLGFKSNEKINELEEQSVAKLLWTWGDPDMKMKVPDYTIDGVSSERGKEIVVSGFTEKPDGGNTKQQSKHFICTSCHNIKREDPDLNVNDPLARLLYTDEKGIPFLQGTTLYGAINRTSFYNGDYEKKYGQLVEPARNDIRASIQLCAVECAQGRELEEWEVESILAFLWDLSIQLNDLNLSDGETAQLTGEITNNERINLLKSKYLQLSEATFVYPPEDRKAGYDYQGNPENGKLIYENSCLHCHYRQRYSFFHLDKGSLSKNHLAAKAGSFGRHSIYQVIRWGVPPKSGKNSYMPQYTKEKMTDEMVEDLRAYLDGDS